MIFDAIRAWSERRSVLRELAAQQTIERERDVMRFTVILERAEAAMAADQRKAAIELWHELRERFYVRATKSPKLFKILLDLHLFDDAEQLMADGFKRRPKDQFYIFGRARVAQLRGDIPLALERWAIVRRNFPWLAEAYAHSAACLISANQIEEAEKMLALGIRKSPADVFCLIEHAKIAETRGNREEALLRWQHLRDVQTEPGHPCYQNGTIGLARCLRIMGRLDEAEAILRPFMDQFGVQEATLMELARIAVARDDWDEAVRRWRRVTKHFPMMMEGYLSLINVLKKTKDTAGLESVLSELTDRFPEELWPARDYAMMAQNSGDNAEIARRWLIVINRFPDYEIAFRQRADALSALGLADEAAALRAEWTKRTAA